MSKLRSSFQILFEGLNSSIYIVYQDVSPNLAFLYRNKIFLILYIKIHLIRIMLWTVQVNPDLNTTGFN